MSVSQVELSNHGSRRAPFAGALLCLAVAACTEGSLAAEGSSSGQVSTSVVEAEESDILSTLPFAVLGLPDDPDPSILADLVDLRDSWGGLARDLAAAGGTSSRSTMAVAYVGQADQAEGEAHEFVEDEPAALEEPGRAVSAGFDLMAINPASGNAYRLHLPPDVLRDIGTKAELEGVNLGSGERGEADAPPAPNQFALTDAGPQPRSWSDGTDNRIRYSSTFNGTTANPINRVVHLSNGCSGSMFGPRHLITAAHCISPAATGDPQFFGVTFAPGRAGNFTPYGTATMPGDGTGWYYVPAEWYQTAAPAGGRTQYDFGLVAFNDDERLGEVTSGGVALGWFGWWYASDSTLDAFTIANRGFPSCAARAPVTGPGSNPCGLMPAPNPGQPRIDDPGDPGSAVVCTANHLYGDPSECDLGEFSASDGTYNRLAMHSCDASAGQSGSPLYFQNPDGAWVVGLVHRGSTCGMYACSAACNAANDRPMNAVRITQQYSDILAWLRSFKP